VSEKVKERLEKFRTISDEGKPSDPDPKGMAAWRFISSITGKIIRSVRTRGIVGTIKLIRYRLSERYHERRLGIDSWRYTRIKELGIENPAYNDYRATDYSGFRRVMKYLKVRNGGEVFLDYGSGMGRAVIVAATYPFRKIIGVEISPELNAIARQNVERARKRLKCSDIELITADVASFRMPPEVMVAYFYNPFRREVLENVLDDIHRSLVEAPRKLTIIFKNPAPSGFEEYVRQSSWLVKRREIASPSELGQAFGIYDAAVESYTNSRPCSSR